MITAFRYFNDPLPNRAQEKGFFAGIRTGNKTFKTTEAVRMAELDKMIVGLSAERGWSRPNVLDVAVSSGVTTFDLREEFRANGIEPSIVATDIAIEASIINVAPGVRALVDTSGAPLQYDCFGLAIRPWNRRIDYLSGYWLLTALLRRIPLDTGSPGRQKVRLISRLAVSEGIKFVEDDLAIFNRGFERRFDVVRAANILNFGYFPESNLVGMIGNLKRYCRGPGALIAINRTHLDGTNHGSIFALEIDDTLRLVERIGDGSEVEVLALTVVGRGRG